MFKYLYLLNPYLRLDFLLVTLWISLEDFAEYQTFLGVPFYKEIQDVGLCSILQEINSYSRS